MKDYWKRLSGHPGVPVAALCSVGFILAGLSREDGAWFLGIIPAILIWTVVLITARTQPIPPQEDA